MPGIGPLAGVAMLLPLTYVLTPASAVIMLAGIFYGAQYGGSITSILVNMPGDASAVVTCLDGHAMAQQGRAGPALAISAIGSFFAGCVSTLAIMLLAPPLTTVALQFGPTEYFSLMAVGLVMAISLAHGDQLKGFAMIVLGLLLGIAGTDVQTGTLRYTFGIAKLGDGIDLVSVAIGLFGFSHIILNLEAKARNNLVSAKIQSLMPSREEFAASAKPIVRGTLLGSLLGVLPGGGAVLSSFASYSLEKRLAADPSRFGQGAIEGVAGPESANNAASQTSLVPLLTLGIPPNPVIALIGGALIVQGVIPGPEVITKQPDLFWGIIASMWIGNIMLLILNLPLVGIWVSLTAHPLSAALSRHHPVFLHWRLFRRQQHLRCLAVCRVRPAWLRPSEARFRARAAAARVHPRAHDGRESATRDAAGARGRNRLPHAAHQSRTAVRRARSRRAHGDAEGTRQAQRSVHGMKTAGFKAATGRRVAMRCVLSALAIWLGLGAMHANAEYPEKPIRIVVPYAAGGTADIFARFVAERLGAKWKHEFIVEVKPGAGGNIGSDYVAKSTPDGYTLLLGTSGSNAVNPSLYKKMPYNAEKDLVLVALVAETANILVVGANHPANSVKDILDLARAKPGRVTFASSGNGSVLHLSGVLLAEKADVKMLHVPYKGAAPALLDVLGGRVDMMIVNGPSAVGDIKGKKLKGLAATTAKRVAALPDMPTMIEFGHRGLRSQLVVRHIRSVRRPRRRAAQTECGHQRGHSGAHDA